MKVLHLIVFAAMTALAAGPAFAGLDNTSVQLPEPGTLALLAGGVATALLIRRKKK